MKITKFTHACVRIEHDGRVLVIDPGTWSEARALVGADAVLVTHEHADHIDVLRLAGLGVPVFVPRDARLPDLAPLPVTRVAAGERFTAAGFAVTAVGGRHAVDPRRRAGLRQPRLPGRRRAGGTTRATRCTCPAGRSTRCWCRPRRPG